MAAEDAPAAAVTAVSKQQKESHASPTKSLQEEIEEAERIEAQKASATAAAAAETSAEDGGGVVEDEVLELEVQVDRLRVAEALPVRAPVAEARVRIFLDLDRQGDQPRHHGILSLGAVACRGSADHELSEFHVNLRPPEGGDGLAGMEPEVRSFWLGRPTLYAAITVNALTASEALARFVAWCRSLSSSSSSPRLHTARVLDFVFLLAYATSFGPQHLTYLSRIWDDSLCASRQHAQTEALFELDDETAARAIVRAFGEDASSHDFCVDDARAYARAFYSTHSGG